MIKKYIYTTLSLTIQLLGALLISYYFEKENLLQNSIMISIGILIVISGSFIIYLMLPTPQENNQWYLKLILSSATSIGVITGVNIIYTQHLILRSGVVASESHALYFGGGILIAVIFSTFYAIEE